MIKQTDKLRLNREALLEIEDALFDLKIKVFEKNPELYFSMAQDYFKSIEEIRAEIDYLLGLSILMESRAPLWIRLAGNFINIWNTPVSVWSNVMINLKNSVSSVAKVLKKSNYISDKTINFLSDFEVTGLQEGSLKIGFNIHTKEQLDLFPSSNDQEAIKLVEEALTKILETSNWFASGKEIEELNSLFDSESIRDFIISQTINLMPSSRSMFKLIEFSGSILPVDKPITLYSQSRKRIKEFIIKKDDEIEKECIGVIREIDLDKQHIILRQREDNGPDLPCNFSEESYNQVKDLLNAKVKITGVIKKGKSSPIYLKFVEIIEEYK